MSDNYNELKDRSRSERPVQTTTHTGYGNMIAKCILTGQPITLPEFTTLNEKFNVLPERSIGNFDSRSLYLKYFGVGVRGSHCDGMDDLGVTKLKVNQHQPIDGSLFTHIPLACRPLEEDFDNTTRAQYRMRVVEEINGVAYVFYYLKLINFENYNPRVLKITRDEDGNENPVPFIPVKDDLFNPQPVDFTSEGSVPISRTYINGSAILDCSLDSNDLSELRNACLIKFGDESYASINEICICYGMDVNADGKIAEGGVIRYTESIATVVGHFVCERDARSATANRRVNLAFDHGASEPMLLHTTTITKP